MKKNIIIAIYCILVNCLITSCGGCDCDCPNDSSITNCNCGGDGCDCPKITQPTPNNCSCSSDCVNCNCGKDNCKCPSTDITGAWKGKDSKGYDVTLSVTETIAIVKYYETNSLLKIHPKQPELKTITIDIDISSFDKTKSFNGKGDDGFNYSAEAADKKATSLKLKLPTEEVTLSR